MTDNSYHNGEYPRPLSIREREWIEWILPANRYGYKSYRDVIGTMMVIGEGRRGKGEIILSVVGGKPDFNEPLAPVAAYGTIETNFGAISVTLREIVNNQISVEIVSHRSEDVPKEFEELRRWTYSTWGQGEPCPQCNRPVREVSMHTIAAGHGHFVLALCAIDKRLWVYDAATGMNLLIPLTNYYNELMLHKNIRDPKIAFDAKRLFSELSNYSDAELTYAFLTYNKIKTKVHVKGLIKADKKEKHRLSHTLRKIFSPYK